MKQTPRLIIALALALGCSDGGGEADGGSEDTGPDVDTDTDVDADGDADTDGDGDSDGDSDGDTDSDADDPWLYTADNHLYRGDGIWHGRGANIHDTRSCWACSAWEPDVDEVIRRLDELIDGWGADFVRLDLESYGTYESWMTQWQGILDDPAYLEDVVAIVDHIGTKDGVYVLLSLWVDPTFTDMGWPSSETLPVWEELAATFYDDHHVLYGLVNEPEYNFDGADDADVWTAMNDTVAAIRAVEASLGDHRHVVAVQGTGGWSRRLDYYVDHPITAGGGANVAYEIHVYNPEADFADMLVAPAATLPVIIGEYGPADGYMDSDDCTALMAQAQALEIPHLAWTFHMRCPPNLLVDNSGGGCGVDMELAPTAWGEQLYDYLAEDW